MTNPVCNGADDEGATTPETRGRVFVNEQQRKTNLWSARKLFYELYIAEMRQTMCEVRDSFDMSRLDQSFCSTCDPRVSLLFSRPIANDRLMEKQISWRPVYDENKSVIGGNFVIHRFWRPNFDLFPSCDSIARDTASRLVKKLQSLGTKGVSHCAQELSYKVQTSFDKGRIRWATAEDFEGTHHYLPQCCVNNLNSSSSPLRLVVVPNRPIFVSKQLGLRTYNSFIRKTSLELPSFLKFSLVTALSAESIFVDISDAFGSVVHSINDQRQSLIFCLRDRNGLPSYDLNQCDSAELHTICQTHGSFGCSDFPKVSAVAMSRLVSVFSEHHNLDEIDTLLLEDVRFCLESLAYVDDLEIPALLHKVLRWSQETSCVFDRPQCQCQEGSCTDWQCPTLVVTEQDLDRFDAYLKEQTVKYLQGMASLFVKVCNFSHYRVKHLTASAAHIQEAIDRCVPLDSQLKEERLGVPVCERPPLASVRAELARLPQSVLSEVEEEGESSKAPPDLASQLGKDYHNGKVFFED